MLYTVVVPKHRAEKYLLIYSNWPKLMTDANSYRDRCVICRTTKVPTLVLKPPMGNMVVTISQTLHFWNRKEDGMKTYYHVIARGNIYKRWGAGGSKIP